MEKKICSIFVLLLIALIAFIPLVSMPLSRSSASSGSPKQTLFWLTNDLSHPSVNGISTYGVMNTSQKFSPEPTVAENTNSLTQDWYLYPTLAGNYTISGTIFLGLWMNATGSSPGGTPTISIFERYPSGTEVSVSGTGTSLGKQSLYNTPHYLNMSITISPYTFSKGSSIHLVFSIQCGSSTTCEIWYGSQSYDSRLSLPSINSMAFSSIATYDYNMAPNSIYSNGLNATQRKVVVLANITDPFGAYDIQQVSVTFAFIATSSAVLSAPMNRTTAGHPTDYSEIYEAIWSYPSSAAGGNYSVTVDGVDNTGIYYKTYFGNPSYGPYLVRGTIYFSIGISVPLTVRVTDSKNLALSSAEVAVMNGEVTYASGLTNGTGYWEGLVFNSTTYNVVVNWENTIVANQSVYVSNETIVSVSARVFYPVFKTTDSAGDPLPNAQVFMTFPNGTSTTLPMYTSENGTLSLSRSPGGEWKLEVYWESKAVGSQVVDVSSSGPFAISTQVYTLSVKVTDGSGSAVSGAYVIIYNGNTVQGFGLTGPGGNANFLLPIGSYTLQAAYTGNYWLTQYSVNASKSIPMSSSSSTTISFSNDPPSFTSTTGFYLIIAAIVIIVAIIAVGALVMKKRK